MPVRPSLPTTALALLVVAGVALAWLAHDAPLAPQIARGWLQADALSALALVVLGALGLVGRALGRPGAWREAAAAGLFALTTVAGHLGVAAALLVAGGAALRPPPAASRAQGRAQPAPWRPWPPGTAVSPSLVATALSGLGLAAVGLTAGEWRYGAPGAGAGLSSASFALLLLGALIAGGGQAAARGHPPETSPLAAVACLYALLRLFSLGPWNLGWLLAAIVAGGGLALGAAWQAAAAPPAGAAAWLGAYLAGLAIAGAGLGSGAGVTLAGYALLVWPVLALGLGAGAGGALQGCLRHSAARWLLAGAVPLTAPFMLAWMAVAAAVAGGLTLLAAVCWLAALLAAAPVVRLAAGLPLSPHGGEREAGSRDVRGAPPSAHAYVAAGLSAALGLGAPAVVAGLLAPAAAQLQGGLSPFGEIELWPWAGLIAFDAARQPVATMPSLALAALMLILSALCWVGLRLAELRRG